MKKLIAAVLALTLLGSAAASAQPFRGNNGSDRGYHDNYRGYQGGYRGDRHGNNGAALIGLGIGLFALAAIASSHSQPDPYYQPDYRAGYQPDYQPGYYGR